LSHRSLHERQADDELAPVAGARADGADRLELYSIDRPLRDALVARLKRRTAMSLVVSGGALHVTIDGETFEGLVTRHALAPAART
jgi:hypothetical protein